MEKIHENVHVIMYFPHYIIMVKGSIANYPCQWRKYMKTCMFSCIFLV